MSQQPNDASAKPTRWIDRGFAFELPLDAYPQVLIRLESMPQRARALGASRSEEILSLRSGPHWSAKENIAHLDDLSPLDEKRLHEYLQGAPTLTPADVTNQATEHARHNEKPWAEILERLERNRLHLVEQLRHLNADQIARTALHIRLNKQFRLIDWLQFVAEHDDHHLAAAERAIAAAEALRGAR